MGDIRLLLTATTDTEFFVMLCNLLRSVMPTVNLRPELKAIGNPPDGYVLQLSVSQTIPRPLPGGGRALDYMVTHTFTLSQTGVLTWQMKDQPTLIGVADIQAALERFGRSLEVQHLPSRTRK